MFRSFFLLILCSWVVGLFSHLHAEELFLRDNLHRAQAGDYLVASAGKTLTLMHIYSKKNLILTIEEITVPSNKRSAKVGWKEWVQQGAPDNTSWVMYDIDLRSGQMLRYYSFTKKNWFEISDGDNFLYKLLNLKLTRISDKIRKRVGPKCTSGPDFRVMWQPRMVVDGKTIEGTCFDAWRTKWPRDGSDLSGKTIDIYLPCENQKYPSYFPYCLQIHGVVGKAKIRIVDSGSQLQSPTRPLPP